MTTEERIDHITALKLSLIAAGFHPVELDDGRLVLAGYGQDVEASLEFDDPYAALPPHQGPLPPADLVRGVALRVRSRVSAERAKQAKLQIMRQLYEVGFRLGSEPPTTD